MPRVMHSSAAAFGHVRGLAESRVSRGVAQGATRARGSGPIRKTFNFTEPLSCTKQVIESSAVRALRRRTEQCESYNIAVKCILLFRLGQGWFAGHARRSEEAPVSKGRVCIP